MKEIELTESFKYGIIDEMTSPTRVHDIAQTCSQYDIKKGSIVGKSPVRALAAPISNEEYHAWYKKQFKPYSLDIERTLMSHRKNKTWSKIERRINSNETAVRLGIHRASVWTRAQVLTWSKLESRKQSAKRWSPKARVRLWPEELALVRSGWELVGKGAA